MARKFRFRLQPVLAQRERLEQEKQVAVAALDRERLAIENKLREYQRSIQGAKLEDKECIIM